LSDLEGNCVPHKPSRFAFNFERDDRRGIVKKLEAQSQVITKNFPYEGLITENPAKLESGAMISVKPWPASGM
jgi:hypothetical protein